MTTRTGCLDQVGGIFLCVRTRRFPLVRADLDQAVCPLPDDLGETLPETVAVVLDHRALGILYNNLALQEAHLTAASTYEAERGQSAQCGPGQSRPRRNPYHHIPPANPVDRPPGT